MNPRVSSVSGEWSVTTSAPCRSSPSVAARSTPRSRKRSSPTSGSYAVTRMPSPAARRATCWPMRPKPTTPSVFPSSSIPLQRERSQRPCFSAACACGMLRARATSSPTVCSAAEMTVDSGAFATTMPRRVAASTSTLSIPTPARAITFRRTAREMSSAVSCVAERITIASYRSMISSSGVSSSTSTSKCDRSRTRPGSAIGSRTRTRIVLRGAWPRRRRLPRPRLDRRRRRPRPAPARSRRARSRCRRCRRSRCARCGTGAARGRRDRPQW